MPRLDFVADILCPWCFIARRHLERALPALRPHGLDIDWVWRPYLLDPAAPPGRDARTHWQARFGSLEAADRYHLAVAEAGRAVGIEFRFDRIARIPDPRDAHRLILFARGHRRQDQVCDALATAYFREGADIGDRDVLTGLAAASGLGRDEAGAMLAGPALLDEVAASDALAKRGGMRAVPAFCLHGKVLTVGRYDDLADRLLRAHDALAGASRW